MRESELERILVNEVRRIGGRAYKWVSPGNDGVPDRIVFLPGGKVYLIELKTDTGKLSVLQKIQINRLQGLGQTVLVVRGMQGLIEFFRVYGKPEATRKLEQKYEVHTT